MTLTERIAQLISVMERMASQAPAPIHVHIGQDDLTARERYRLANKKALSGPELMDDNPGTWAPGSAGAPRPYTS